MIKTKSRTAPICLLFMLVLGKTNDQNQRVTYICHPAYLSYITKHSGDDEIDYASIQEWDMPDKSFFEYLFHTV